MGNPMKVRSSLLATTALAAVAVLTLTGCDTAAPAPSTSEGSGDAKLTTLTAGTLTVCSDIPYEPFELLGPDGKATGFDIDIVQAVADANGLKLEVIDSSFDAITSGLFKSQCDIAISSISITPERAANMDFSEPYYDDDLVLIAPADTTLTSVADAKGKKVGVQSDTTGESYGDEQGIETIGYEDSGLQTQALLSGQLDAALGNQSVLKFAIKGNDKFKVIEEISTGEQLGVAVPKDKAEMLAAVNATIKELKDSGKLDELEAKWFEGK